MNLLSAEFAKRAVMVKETKLVNIETLTLMHLSMFSPRGRMVGLPHGIKHFFFFFFFNFVLYSS